MGTAVRRINLTVAAALVAFVFLYYVDVFCVVSSKAHANGAHPTAACTARDRRPPLFTCGGVASAQQGACHAGMVVCMVAACTAAANTACAAACMARRAAQLP